ncbi:MAG: type II secretion system protein [Sedimentisphaerales bacterium]|nr:type II secretion system protein [Sedimentisphaerales bacterium]
MKKNSKIKKQNSFKCAFTLIELLVVIAIVALLLSILFPSLRKAGLMAARLACAHNLKQISLAVDFYLNENDSFYPGAQDPVSVDPTYWLWMGRGWRFLVEPYIGVKIDPNNPSILFCSQDKTSKQNFESTSYAYSMAFYHSPEQIDDMNSPTDTYINPRPSVPQRNLNVTNPSGKILIGEWLSNHSPLARDQGWWTWEGSRNYLFADGHIRYLKAKQIRPANDRLPDVNLTTHGIKGTDYPP